MTTGDSANIKMIRKYSCLFVII